MSETPSVSTRDSTNQFVFHILIISLSNPHKPIDVLCSLFQICTPFLKVQIPSVHNDVSGLL